MPSEPDHPPTIAEIAARKGHETCCRDGDEVSLVFDRGRGVNVRFVHDGKVLESYATVPKAEALELASLLLG